MALSCKSLLVIYGAVAFYFLASVSLTFFNKWFFTEVKPSASPTGEHTNASLTFPASPSPSSSYSKYAFHFPLTVTCLHQFLVFLLVLATEKNFLSRFVGEITRGRSVMNAVVPIGIASGLDWGLSNTSLRWIPLIMYETVKCSSPVFILAVGWWLQIQTFTIPIGICMIAMTVGTFLTVTGGDVGVFNKGDFPLEGFVCVCVATMIASFRVMFAQKVLQGDNLTASVNTATFLYYATPSSCLILLLPALVIEGPLVQQYLTIHNFENNFHVFLFVVLSSIIAYFLSLSEYILTKTTSGLTLCVTGTAKQAVITALAMAIFHEKLNLWSAIGVTASISAIAAYKIIRYRELTVASPSNSCEASATEDGVELSSREKKGLTYQSVPTAEDIALAKKSDRYEF